MALALAPHDIRVNAIGPGSIQTQVLQSVVTDDAARHRCNCLLVSIRLQHVVFLHGVRFQSIINGPIVHACQSK